MSSSEPGPAHSDAYVSPWRERPYRLLFPLGWLLLLAGVGPWMWVSLGGVGHPSAYHSIAQVQGFLLCFAVGFLLTLVPRRTATAAPSWWQLGVHVVCPVGTTVCGAIDEFAWSQTFWCVQAVFLVWFVASRFRRASASRRLPGLAWVYYALLFGLVGAVLFGVYGALGPGYPRVHELAKGFLLQGLMLGLVLGIGPYLIPLITRGVPFQVEGRGSWVVHGVGALLLAGTFCLEVLSGWPQLGLLARGLLCALWLIRYADLLRPPTRAGVQRWLVWSSAWMIVLGYGLAGTQLGWRHLGLHVVFLGGFATMVFAVGAHVVMSHEPAGNGSGWWQLMGFAVAMLGAIVGRSAMVMDPGSYLMWMGVAAAGVLLAALFWASLVLPLLWRGIRATR